jgi:hypothetical protein
MLKKREVSFRGDRDLGVGPDVRKRTHLDLVYPRTSGLFAVDYLFVVYAPHPFVRFQGVQVRSGHPTHVESTKYGPIMAKAVVLCKSLLIMHTDRHGDWLLYLHSDLAFFTFNHPYLEFGDSFHLHLPTPQRASILPV